MARYACINVALAIFAALIVLALAGVTIAAIILNSNQNSLQRFCFDKPNMLGSLSMWTNERQIGWDLQYRNLSGVVTGLAIHGPIPAGLTDGPLAVALCGLGTTLACDLSTPGVLKDKIIETGTGGPLKPIIQTIRNEPWRFIFKLKTSAVMTGETEAKLTSLCGTPV